MFLKVIVYGPTLSPARTVESQPTGRGTRKGYKTIAIKFLRITLLMAVLIVSPLLSFSQYFQQLYDVDSAQEWGWSIYPKPDSDYFIGGWFFNQNTDKGSFFSVVIDNNGLILNSSTLKTFGSVSTIGSGNNGELKPLANGDGYIVPITIQWPDPITHYLYSSGGIAKLNSNGDTIFVKSYTDTSVYFDLMNTCGEMQNGKGYLIGGGRGYDTPGNYYPSYLIRTDTFGDTIWTHTYRKRTDQPSQIFNINPLADGQVAIGATSEYQQFISGFGNINHYTPWFFIIDSSGNIIKDSLYGARYGGGVALNKDLGIGYYNYGELDTLITPDPTDNQNFTDYFARLDSNFSIDWMVTFPYDEYDGHRVLWQVRQSHDSSYIIVGNIVSNTAAHIKGWAAKVNKYGSVVWNQFYFSDNYNDAYLRDVVERPDGGFIFTGQSFNDTLPSWHQHFDLWVVGVDSNGCEDGLCAPAAVQRVVKGNELLVYPNPTNSILNFEFPASGNVTIKLMDITGRVLDEQQVANSASAAFSVRNYTPGLYLYQFITGNTTRSGKFIVQ